MNQLCFEEETPGSAREDIKINSYTENKILDLIKNKKFYLTKRGKERYGKDILKHGGEVTAKVVECDYFVSDAVSKASTAAKELNKIFD